MAALRAKRIFAVQTIHRWIDERARPVSNVGGIRKFQKDQIDEWVRAGGIPPEDSSGSDSDD